MLSVSNLSKAFGNQSILTDITFRLAAGQVLAVLGRSGCGKTTLLKILAGLETPDQGEVQVHEQSVLTVPPNERQIVYLYQEPLLFPHLNVFENVAFGLRIRRTDSASVARQTTDMLEELGIADQAQKQPHQLSGGQRQRVAFGRALIIKPRLLLLDEPFGNLDSQTRAAMQALFIRVAQQHRMTSLFVTHDSREALTIGTTFAYLDRGTLTNYESIHAFTADPRTGIQDELAFWDGIQVKTTDE